MSEINDEMNNAFTQDAPAGTAVTFHGVRIVIPEGLHKTEQEESEEARLNYADAEDTSGIDLTFQAGGRDVWKSMKATVNAEFKEAAEGGLGAPERMEMEFNGCKGLLTCLTCDMGVTEFSITMLLIRLSTGVCLIEAKSEGAAMGEAIAEAVLTLTVEDGLALEAEEEDDDDDGDDELFAVTAAEEPAAPVKPLSVTAPAPENGRVLYGGLALEIPETFRLDMQDENSVVYRTPDMLVYVTLRYNEMDLREEVGYYISLQTFMDGEYYDGEVISCSDGELIGGCYTVFADYRETDGRAVQKIWRIQTMDRIVITLRIYEPNPAALTDAERADVDALIRSIAIDEDAMKCE